MARKKRRLLRALLKALWYGLDLAGIEEDADDLTDERRVKLASVLGSTDALLICRCDCGDYRDHIVEPCS